MKCNLAFFYVVASNPNLSTSILGTAKVQQKSGSARAFREKLKIPKNFPFPASATNPRRFAFLFFADRAHHTKYGTKASHRIRRQVGSRSQL